MASATGIPEVALRSSDENMNRESEPLLGRPGDVLQRPGESIVNNLYRGKAPAFI